MFENICGGLMPFSFLTAAVACAISGLVVGAFLQKYQPIPPWNRKPAKPHPSPKV